MQRRGFFGRLADLWRGIFRVKLSAAEARNAEVVYHNAILEHERHHEKLKETLGRMIYLRNRVEAERRERAQDLTIVEDALHRAVAGGEDERSLGLIRKRRSLAGELERLAGELARLSLHTDKTKVGLKEVGEAVKHLKLEREEMLARKAHALARRDVQEALKALQGGGLSGTLSALDGVRESILELEQRVDLGDEPQAESGEPSMDALRREAALVAERDELARLKADLAGRTLPEPSVVGVAPSGNLFAQVEVVR